MKKYNIYKIEINYFKEDYNDFAQSTCGQSEFYVASINCNKAKSLAINKFKKEYDKFGELDKIIASSKLVKSNIIKAIKEGFIKL